MKIYKRIQYRIKLIDKIYYNILLVFLNIYDFFLINLIFNQLEMEIKQRVKYKIKFSYCFCNIYEKGIEKFDQYCFNYCCI